MVDSFAKLGPGRLQPPGAMSRGRARRTMPTTTRLKRQIREPFPQPQPRARREQPRKRGRILEVASALLAVTIGSLSIRQCEPTCVYANNGSTVYAVR